MERMMGRQQGSTQVFFRVLSKRKGSFLSKGFLWTSAGARLSDMSGFSVLLVKAAFPMALL